MVASSLESITAKLVQQLQQQGGQSSKQEDSKQIEQLQQLQHFFDQQQKSQQQQQQKGGQYQQQQQQQAGNVKVYTGPKDGKFIINKHGKKVYIDRKTLNANLQYQKAKPKAKKAKKARK
jgi:hypothetical protein